MSNINPYAENLKMYRVREGLSQEQMAKRLKLKNQQAYQYYEVGNITEKKARQFSILLNYDLTKTKTVVAAITVILKYIACLKAQHENISITEALRLINEEIELSSGENLQ